MGPKKAWGLIEDREKLKQLLTEDILVAKSFKRNKQLISMKEIPEKVKNLILEEFEKVNLDK